MTQANPNQNQTVAAEPVGAGSSAFTAAALGLRTVAFSLLVDRALSA